MNGLMGIGNTEGSRIAAALIETPAKEIIGGAIDALVPKEFAEKVFKPDNPISETARAVAAALDIPPEVRERWPLFPLIDHPTTDRDFLGAIRLILSIAASSPVYKHADLAVAPPSASAIPEVGEKISAGLMMSAVGKKIADERILSAQQGHGYLAEQVNNFEDKLRGRDAKIVGGDLAKDGADRIVDGVNIQTKYYNNANGTVNACFQDGKFRYMNPDGTTMQIEVPKDQYNDAVQIMREKIRSGHVEGITDPAKASDIIREGYYTYDEVGKIAKAGNIDSLKYDAKNGVVIAGGAMSISALITFAYSIWNGDDVTTALKKSVLVGGKSGLLAFGATVISSQVQKAGIQLVKIGRDQLSKIASGTLLEAKKRIVDAGGKILGRNASSKILSTSGKNLLYGNIITGAVSTTLLSSKDFYDCYNGKISGAQCFKNVAKTGAGVAGSAGGWAAGAAGGAAVGTAVLPGVGTAVGGILGGLAGALGGGMAAEAAAGAVLDTVIDDDAVKAKKAIEAMRDEFSTLASDYIATEKETGEVMTRLDEKLDEPTFRELMAANDKPAAAREMLAGIFHDVISERENISMPSDEDMRSVAADIFNSIPEPVKAA